eukprot:g23512.t1
MRTICCEGFIKDVKALQKYIEEELNVVELNFRADAEITLSGTLNFKELGKRLGKDMKADAVTNLSQAELVDFEKTGEITIQGHKLAGDDIQLSRKLKERPSKNRWTMFRKDLDNPNLDVNGDDDTQVILDFTEDEDLKLMAVARDIVNKVQKMRKDAGFWRQDTKLMQDDPVDMWAEVKSGKKSKGLVHKSMTSKRDYIIKLLRRGLWDASLRQGHEVLINEESFVIQDDDELVVSITARGPFFNPTAMKELTKHDPKAEAACREYLQTYDLDGLIKVSKKPVKVNFDGKSFEMQLLKHFVIGSSLEDDTAWTKRN